MTEEAKTKRRPRILLVDDHDDTRRFLLLALEFEGFDVVGASTAEEALRYLQSGNFDILLSDYCLPGHSGGWLLAQATKAGFIAAERALVLTAHPGPDGVDDFQLLRKPFELDDLVATIRTVMLTASPASTANPSDVDLVLYISSQSYQSLRAVRHLHDALDQLDIDVRLTVRDLATDPSAGVSDRIRFTPTLLKRGPGARTRLIGDCSDIALLHEFLQGCDTQPLHS